MASIFKRVRWVAGRDLVDPATGRAYRKGHKCPKGVRGAVQVRSRNYTIAVKLPGGRVKTFDGGRDRTAAERLASNYEVAKQRGDLGLTDPHAQHRRRPLAEHMEDWLRDLEAKGRSKKYRRNVRGRLTALFRACNWGSLADVSADRFARWRDGQPRLPDGRTVLGPVTLNQYLEAARSLMRWCVKRGRWPADPLTTMEKMDAGGDVRYPRRSLTPEQLVQLMAVLPPVHLTMYRLVLSTGLRRSEVRQLCWQDLHLTGPRPFLQLRERTTKARRADALPLRADVAAELLRHRGEAGDGEPVFATMPTVPTHKRYLAAAGIPWLDEDGRRADFHALRHTYGTLLSHSGASPREAMELMRHTDLRLTMRFYTDPKIFNLAGRVENLPLPAPAADPARKPPASVAAG